MIFLYSLKLNETVERVQKKILDAHINAVNNSQQPQTVKSFKTIKSTKTMMFSSVS